MPIRASSSVADELQRLLEHEVAAEPRGGRKLAKRLRALLKHAAHDPGAGDLVRELPDPALREVRAADLRFIYAILDDKLHLVAVAPARRPAPG